MELSIYREYDYISKICEHITTHYNMCIQDMLCTILAFQVTTLSWISQQCFIVPISKPEEEKL